MAELTPEGRLYHYGLQRANNLRVREQATQINKSLKRLKKLSSPDWPKAPEREPTEQFVTIPDPETSDLTLYHALEDAERAYTQSEPPKPRRKPRWFGWPD